MGVFCVDEGGDPGVVKGGVPDDCYGRLVKSHLLKLPQTTGNSKAGTHGMNRTDSPISCRQHTQGVAPDISQGDSLPAVQFQRGLDGPIRGPMGAPRTEGGKPQGQIHFRKTFDFLFYADCSRLEGYVKGLGKGLGGDIRVHFTHTPGFFDPGDITGSFSQKGERTNLIPVLRCQNFRLILQKGLDLLKENHPV